MTEPPALNDDFRDLLGELVEASARFVIVGAHAMAVHGVPRATGDLDILVEPTKENARRVCEALRRFGAPLEQHRVTERDFALPGTVYQIGIPPRRIDLLTQISGVGFDEAWGSAVEAKVSGLLLRFLGREALIKNKRAAGRDKDLVDVRILEGRRS